MLTISIHSNTKLPYNLLIRKLNSKMQIFHIWNNCKELFKGYAANNV